MSSLGGEHIKLFDLYGVAIRISYGAFNLCWNMMLNWVIIGIY